MGKYCITISCIFDSPYICSAVQFFSQFVLDFSACCTLQICTGGSCLMLLLGPGKKTHQPKIALAKFLFYVRSNKIFSPKNRISQILVIVLKNRINETRSNEIRIRRELLVYINEKRWFRREKKIKIRVCSLQFAVQHGGCAASRTFLHILFSLQSKLLQGNTVLAQQTIK